MTTPVSGPPVAATCGANPIVPPERLGGCGDPIYTCAEVYRCTECGVPFHRACADRHFGDSKEQTQAYKARIIKERDEAARDRDIFRVALARALSLSPDTITIESAQAWINDWNSRQKPEVE